MGAGSWARNSQKNEINSPIENSNFQLTYDEPEDIESNLSEEQIKELVRELKSEMENAAKQLDFEQAAKLRDRIYELERMLYQ